MSSAITGTGNGSSGGNSGNLTASSATGAVDVDNWSFYGRQKDSRPVPYLVGPVVGTVTETDARVLIEVERTRDVTMEAFMDGQRVDSRKMVVQARTPTIFKLRNLAAGKRVRVTVSVGEFGQEREARFTTPMDKNDWKVAVVSCNSHARMEKLGLWVRLSKVVQDLDCVVHLGDQVYADHDLPARNDPTVTYDSAWKASKAIIDPLTPEQYASRRDEMLECYRRIYRQTWNSPMVAKVLANTANYMICDDHEVVDDFGDMPEHSDPSTMEYFLIQVGYQVYCEYQRQLLCDTDVTDSKAKAYYGIKLSPKLGIFMTDNRVERSLHRREGSPESWKDRDFLGPAQWARLQEAFRVDFKDCDTVLFGAPTPLVFMSQAATNVAEKVIDDAKGTWGHKDFKVEQAALCKELSTWQVAQPNRAVITLGGDVHIGGFTDSWHNHDKVPLHQLTSSAIGNIPEGNLDGVKRGILRQVMHADEHLFEFKVRHHDWVYGPNFGVIDMTVGKGATRPDVAMTLVPWTGAPKIRNLTLGDSNVSVSSKDQHNAAVKAHEAAIIMEGMVVPQAACCTCAIS